MEAWYAGRDPDPVSQEEEEGNKQEEQCDSESYWVDHREEQNQMNC